MADRTGETPLSERELELLRLVATGATNQQIARELVISVNTVKVHLRNIFEKMGVESRTEAMMVAIRQGWVEVESGARPAEAPAEPLERISPAQRIFLAAAAVIVFALALSFPMTSRLARSQSASPFTERPAVSSLLVSDEGATRWSILSEMPARRGRLAVAYHDGSIFVIGGDTDLGVTGRMDAYDVARGRWDSLPDKPTPAGNISAAVAAGRIWAPGGYLANGRIASLVEAYDLEAGQWSRSTPLPEPICAYALAAFEDDLYLFGGANDQGYLDVGYRFDAATEQWEALPALSSPRAFAAAAVLDGRIYVVGGYDGSHELAACQVFDPRAFAAGRPAWSDCAPLTVGRGGLGLAAVGSTLYAVGGGWEHFLAFNEQYDPEKDAWSPFSSPISGEWRNLAAVSDERVVYAAGGWDGQYLSSLWAYRAIVTIFLPITP